jgi:hypothetical protein
MNVNIIQKMYDNDCFGHQIGFSCPECSCIEDDQYTCSFCNGYGANIEIDAKDLIQDLLKNVAGSNHDWSVSSINELFEENNFNDHILTTENLYGDEFSGSSDIDGYIEISLANIFNTLFAEVDRLKKKV